MDPRSAPVARRRRLRPVPERDADYAHLGLPELRAYRSALQEEESRVSYWRRILQARLDVVRAGGTEATRLDTQALRPVLASASGGRRAALVEVLPAGDMPPLPRLAELWERRVPAADGAAMATLEGDLSEAEEQLSAYRAALHARLAGCTGELIARYREQPALCLVALPLPRPRSAPRP